MKDVISYLSALLVTFIVSFGVLLGLGNLSKQPTGQFYDFI